MEWENEIPSRTWTWRKERRKEGKVDDRIEGISIVVAEVVVVAAALSWVLKWRWYAFLLKRNEASSLVVAAHSSLLLPYFFSDSVNYIFLTLLWMEKERERDCVCGCCQPNANRRRKGSRPHMRPTPPRPLPLPPPFVTWRLSAKPVLSSIPFFVCVLCHCCLRIVWEIIA